MASGHAYVSRILRWRMRRGIKIPSKPDQNFAFYACSKEISTKKSIRKIRMIRKKIDQGTLLLRIILIRIPRLYLVFW